MNLANVATLGTQLNTTRFGQLRQKEDRNETFDQVFQSISSMIQETNQLSNQAKEEEIKYALGFSENTHDLQVAQAKANTSLQYTVSIKNKILEAYKEIMNLQF